VGPEPVWTLWRKENLVLPGIEARPYSPLLYQPSYPQRKIMVAGTDQCESTFCCAMSSKITNNSTIIYNMYILIESSRGWFMKAGTEEMQAKGK
jgi:hypothetical protein